MGVLGVYTVLGETNRNPTTRNGQATRLKRAIAVVERCIGHAGMTSYR